METIWREQRKRAEREVLTGNMAVDTVVIGAGMAGILTASFLKERGREVIVLEADGIGSGQTEKTTAKITSQHGMIYKKLVKEYGEEKAAGYAQANEEAIRAYAGIIEDYQIACDFQRLPAYLYSERDEQGLKEEARIAERLGIHACFVKEGELPFEIAGMVCFENQAQFHPLKFLEALAEPLTVYEHTRALSVSGHRIRTDRAEIYAEHIVFATHYPFLNVPGFYFLRMHQERSYVLGLHGARELHGMYYSADDNGLSLRSAGETLLLGGGGHRTGEQERNSGYDWLRSQAKRYYPDCEEFGHWSAQDCMTHDGLPMIGRYSMLRPYWYIASGFKKWGMTSAMISAMLICDAICGRENAYQELFTPQRFHLAASAGNLLKDMGKSVKGLCKGAACTLSGRKERRCPHMGCALEWNPQEKSWDCPCHGSRFDGEGRLLDNPAQKSKKSY